MRVRADVIPWRASEFAQFRNTPNTLAYPVAKDGCYCMSAEVLIASYLRIANEDLAGARQLSATGNRNAMYLCSQAKKCRPGAMMSRYSAIIECRLATSSFRTR
jgi:hypothetical protein